MLESAFQLSHCHIRKGSIVILGSLPHSPLLSQYGVDAWTAAQPRRSDAHSLRNAEAMPTVRRSQTYSTKSANGAVLRAGQGMILGTSFEYPVSIFDVSYAVTAK